MKFEVMDQSGHSTLEFDKSNDTQVKEAMEKFEQLVGKDKMLAATRKTGERDYTVAKTFDQVQDETMFRPQMKGG